MNVEMLMYALVDKQFSYCLEPEYCAYVEECNNKSAYNEATENFPTKVALHPNTASEVYNLAYILKGVKKQIERLVISGVEDVLPLFKAISDMSGSVSTTA